ncbi:MAG: T9SS type A sorting domain-containing protein [Rhizobacter sp.]|nr:T9SS type A sorting domain-containing protein [Chlorobiales bacterium]
MKKAFYFLAALLMISGFAADLRAQTASGLQLWLKANEQTGLLNGDSVSTWTDASGNGRNATSTGTFRPTFLTNAVNGLPAMRFVGNGSTAKDQPLMFVDLATGSAASVFVVFANQLAGDPPLPSDNVHTLIASKPDFPQVGFGLSTYNSFAGTGGRAIRTEGGNGAGPSAVLKKNGTTTNTNIALGEYAIATYTGTDIVNSGGYTEGLVINALRDSARAGQQDIAEILVYNRVLTAIEALEVETYLSNKYAIALSVEPRETIAVIPSVGLTSWLRASDLPGSGVANGGAVTAWPDVTSTLKFAVSGGTSAPTLVTDRVNKLPAVRFDGVNDTVGLGISTGATVTAFIVAANQRTPSGGDLPDNTTDYVIASINAGGNGFGIATSNNTTSDGPARLAAINIATGTQPSTFKKNGTSAPLSLAQGEFAYATYSSAGITPGGRTRLGAALDAESAAGTNFGQNDIAEVIVYNRVLTPEEFLQVELYLKNRYNISNPTYPSGELTVEEFTVADTLLNGWAIARPAGPRDRYKLDWINDGGRDVMKISVSDSAGNGVGTVGINGQYRPDGGDGGFDALFKTFKSSATDTTQINLANRQVLHLFAKTPSSANPATTGVRPNGYGASIPPTVRIDLQDATKPPYIASSGEVRNQFHATNGGGPFSNVPDRNVSLIADDTYREYIFDFTGQFRGTDFGFNFGFGDFAQYNVDNTSIQQLNLFLNAANDYAFRYDIGEGGVIPIRAFTGNNEQFIPIYQTQTPRFRGEVYLDKIVANSDPYPQQRQSSSEAPVIAPGATGAYVLGNTGAYIDVVLNAKTSPLAVAASVAPLAGLTAADTVVQVVDTVGILNVYRINDGSGQHSISPLKVWTIAAAGVADSVEYDISIDAAGTTSVSAFKYLYVAYRPNSSSPWTALSTYTSGTFLKAFAVQGFGQFAVASQSSRNPTLEVIRTGSTIAKDFRLMQNYPNPFNPATTIQYSIPTAETVSLKVYDILGREVATLVNSRQIAGTYRVNFNAARFASGMYFYRVKAGDVVLTKKMMLIK